MMYMHAQNVLQKVISSASMLINMMKYIFYVLIVSKLKIRKIDYKINLEIQVEKIKISKEKSICFFWELLHVQIPDEVVRSVVMSVTEDVFYRLGTSVGI